MDLNDLNYDYDDEFVYGGSQQEDDNSNEEDNQQQQIQNEEEPDVIESYLKNQGISDIHKIKFEEDDGSYVEKDWDELSHDERLNILQSGNQDPELDLDDDEINLINTIRSRRMTPQQFIESLTPQQQQTIEEEPIYMVDDMSDDELYMLDLQTRIEDITEEQLQNALTKAKEDEDLFKKQVNGIREEYKRLEDEKNVQYQAQQEELLNQQYQQFSNNINTAIYNLKNIGELDVSMDNNDMEELSSFILDRDDTGTSYFARALNNPNELVRMAWFALHGDEIFNQISDYYKKQISQVSKNSYQKGFDAAKSGKEAPNKVVIKKQNGKQPLIKSVDNIIY